MPNNESEYEKEENSSRGRAAGWERGRGRGSVKMTNIRKVLHIYFIFNNTVNIIIVLPSKCFLFSVKIITVKTSVLLQATLQYCIAIMESS